ncbi:hypothetical protein M0805_006343 [Coniferiporia weirii]|nr:hypothetical protein M0805_006343 [Coniferiporia weirii]
MSVFPDRSHGYEHGEYEAVALGHPDRRHSSEDGTAPQYNISADHGNNPRSDSFSMNSMSPLAPRANADSLPTMRSMPVAQDYSIGYSPGPGAGRPPLSQATTGRTHRANSSSWDVLAGLRKFEQSYEGFDSRNATEDHLRFAQGDMPNNKFTKLYNYLINVSVVTRWTLFIVPVLALIWIPGILGLTAFKNTTIWHVKLIWWSIWLSVVWGGWWGALAFSHSHLLPRVARSTIGIVAVGSRKYIDWLGALVRYVALFGWTLAIWISFQPLIIGRSIGNEKAEISFIAKLLFGIYLCSSLLLFEKFSIQWIAGKFHERSYADRIANQKVAVNVLVILYSHSSEIPGRSDTLKDRDTSQKIPAVDPRRFFKRALKGVRVAATTTTTALGNVASEIAGSSVLQPNSPQAMVQTALRSANKTRLLARRLYYSFCKSGRDSLVLSDVTQFFTSLEQAQTAFSLFDKDDNGDVSREEVEMACMDVHREQLSIENSMRDLDSAVGRLDNIFMSLYVVVACLIIAVVLDAQFASVLTGAGTLVLGLSWLIGSSLQEVLSSIIFLFIKHPYDVGDRVNITNVVYTVKEIRLLSTIFLDGNNCLVQAPHTVLNTQLIHNIRRSPQMSETFEFEVAYSTTLEQIENLREKMVAFVQSQGRDFLPSFDVVVKDIPDQEKMVLSADIKYKSNWQQGAVKVKRRNMWICALKTALAELSIFGSKGNPNAEPSPTMYTEVPWEEVRAKQEAKKQIVHDPAPVAKQYNLSDKNAAVMDSEGVFDEAGQMYSSNPRVAFAEGTSSSSSRLPPRGTTGMSMPAPTPAPTIPLPQTPEEYALASMPSLPKSTR